MRCCEFLGAASKKFFFYKPDMRRCRPGWGSGEGDGRWFLGSNYDRKRSEFRN